MQFSESRWQEVMRFAFHCEIHEKVVRALKYSEYLIRTIFYKKWLQIIDTAKYKWYYLLALGRYGGVAQLGEHLPCKQGVSGSIPLISTNRQVLYLGA